MPDPQRCIAPPAIPTLSLPPGVGFSLPGIGVAFNPKFCCKLPSLAAALPPTPIPAVAFSILASALALLMTQVNAVVAMTAIRCPRL